MRIEIKGSKLQLIFKKFINEFPKSEQFLQHMSGRTEDTSEVDKIKLEIFNLYQDDQIKKDGKRKK